MGDGDRGSSRRETGRYVDVKLLECYPVHAVFLRIYDCLHKFFGFSGRFLSRFRISEKCAFSWSRLVGQKVSHCLDFSCWYPMMC